MTGEPLDLNLLPQHHRGFRLMWWHAALALTLLGLLFTLYPGYRALRKEQEATSLLRSQVKQTQELLATLQVDQNTLDDLDRKIAEVEARLQQLKREAEVLRQQADNRTPSLITAVAQCPAEITLTRLEQRPGRLTVQGHTTTQFQVLEYARRLEESKRFVNVRVEVIESHSADALLSQVTFTIVAEE
ncbi:MAG: PilN domain-containing protein [Anaerolineae bacterium]